MLKRGLILFLASTLFFSCAPERLREAEEVVAQADSLHAAGQMYGIDAGDSATLAQAYETLGSLSLFNFHFSPSYAHACYHYGRLLREKDNPVEAMQCFINATHTRTRDYHILGRVYSNMGSICHLAGEFQLSYDMYERSAEMFLQCWDSTAYFYALNDMAFELAEQGKKEEALALVRQISTSCSDANVISLLNLAKITLYYRVCEYDTVLLISNQLDGYYATGYALRARAYWHLEQKDSALYWAKVVLDMPTSSNQDRYNMIYIILNGDSTLQTEEVLHLSERRADIEAKILVPLHKKYAVAANLLRQDLRKKPWSFYIIPISIGLLLIICLLTFYARRIHSEKTQKEEILHTVQQQQTAQMQHKQKDIELACEAIRKSSDWQQEIHWKEYNILCQYIDKHCFFVVQKLKEKKLLTEREIRLCILVLIGGFSDKQMAELLYYGEKSIRGMKRYTAQKLGTSSANLRMFLMEL